MHAKGYVQAKTGGRLEAAVDLYEPLFSRSPDAILICADGLVHDANQGAVALLAAGTPEALVGIPLRHILAGPERVEVDGLGGRPAPIRHIHTGREAVGLNSIAARNASSITDACIRRMDGTEFGAEVSVLPSRGEVFYVIIRDLTDDRYDGMLADASERSERLEHLKRTFLMNVSHEIRTPLTGILGFADILAKEVSNDHRELAVMMRRNGERLMKTLTSILDLAQIEYGEVALSAEPLNLSEQLAHMVDSFQAQANECGLFLNIDMNGHDQVEVDADAVAFQRVIMNLLSNAIKFTCRGGVTIRVDADGDTATVHVEDTGIGIREEALPHVFDDFRQESDGIARAFEGVGLGLAICRRLANLMLGSLSAKSVRGRGSTFSLTLPRSPVSVSSALPSIANIDDAVSVRCKRILAVDDGEELGLFLSHALDDTFVVDIVDEFSEAGELVSRKSYDLILLPVEPNDGPALVSMVTRLRGMTDNHDILVLAVLDHALSDDTASLLLAGFDGCLRKPLRLDDLLRTIGSVNMP